MLLAFCLLTLLMEHVDVARANPDWSADMSAKRWNVDATQRINKLLNRRFNGNLAKNIILFLGDGMGISTVTAGRIRKGQLKGNNGEEEITFMESLPHVGLAKTYNIDAQTADSAGTATAYLTGVKTRIGVLGLDGRAVDCPTSKGAELDSMLKWAHHAGKSVGLVTTSRITHATPGGSYAHVPDRDWEAFDGLNFNETHKQQGCKDIAAQLVEDNNFINLMFAGGRGKFMRNTEKDPVEANKYGQRIDDRNLIDEWTALMRQQNLRHKFLWNASELNQLKAKQYDRILGLFSHSLMSFETKRVKQIPVQEPSLLEMAEKAIEILSADPNGFFLLVEEGRIDDGHHISNAQQSLNHFALLDEAVGEALQTTSERDTLIVVTADHSHVFTMGGYSVRGNPILGINLNKYANVSEHNLTYTSLMYGNGPGGLRSIRRHNLTNEETGSTSYQQESAVYLKYETHGGEDVAIFASGPMSFLLDGTFEQNYIPHVMAYSACIGPYNRTNYAKCAENRGVLVKRSLKSAGASSPSLLSFASTSSLSFVAFATVRLIIKL